MLDAYRRTLGGRQAEIRRLQAAHDESVAVVNTMRAEIDALRSEGDTGAANARVSEFKPLVRAHNAIVEELRVLVDEFNQLVRT